MQDIHLSQNILERWLGIGTDVFYDPARVAILPMGFCFPGLTAKGADLLMVKPGMSSADLIGPIGARTGLPVGAYQVSGEYAGLTLLAREGLTDFDAALLESWYVLRRAGAAFIITYGARHAARLGLA